jgi:hypothetical protein
MGHELGRRVRAIRPGGMLRRWRCSARLSTDRCCPWRTVRDRCYGHAEGTAGGATLAPAGQQRSPARLEGETNPRRPLPCWQTAEGRAAAARCGRLALVDAPVIKEPIQEPDKSRDTECQQDREDHQQGEHNDEPLQVLPQVLPLEPREVAAWHLCASSQPSQGGGVPLTVEKWTDVGSGDGCYAAAATASSTTSLGADGLNS